VEGSIFRNDAVLVTRAQARNNGVMRLFSPDPVTFFARTLFRNQRQRFGIKRNDRLSHIYLIGKTGAGKSTLLETMMLQDIGRGEGFTLLDPHGDLVERIAQAIPPQRRKDLIYFDVSDPDQPYGYNPLKRVAPDKRSLAASGILEVFHKTWGERAWGQRMEHILRNALLLLLDQPEATLADLLTLFRDEAFRKNAAKKCTNRQVRDFWLLEFPKYARFSAEAVAPIQSKVSAFLSDPTLCRVLTTPRQPIQIRKLMDDGKILLVNLAKGKLGEDSAALLGGLLVTTIGLAAFSRADMPEQDRRAHWLYIDEFQSFTTLSLANMLSELRKYKVGMTLAHQYLHQLDPDIRHAVLGNAATLIAFRLGAPDAAYIAREFDPKFNATDVLTLPNYHIYLKLLIDGEPSKPFSATTLAVGNAPVPGR
jgi:type IV secretory pathway TraG/TraD family ATPase VirD4